jgi:hypothetical protein
MGWRTPHYGFGRSQNAYAAEEEERFPLTRAAAYLGLNVRAFIQGCLAVNAYPSREWHHVGAYGARVNYYDTRWLRRQRAFWEAAAASYKSAHRRAEVLATAALYEKADSDESQDEPEPRAGGSAHCNLSKENDHEILR